MIKINRQNLRDVAIVAVVATSTLLLQYGLNLNAAAGGTEADESRLNAAQAELSEMVLRELARNAYAREQSFQWSQEVGELGLDLTVKHPVHSTWGRDVDIDAVKAEMIRRSDENPESTMWEIGRGIVSDWEVK